MPTIRPLARLRPIRSAASGKSSIASASAVCTMRRHALRPCSSCSERAYQNFPAYREPCRNDTGIGGGQAALNGTPVAIGSPEWNFCAGWLGLSTALVDQAATDAVLDSFWQSDAQFKSLLFGNAGLQSEESETVTYGAVFTHNFGFGDINAAVDYYNIEVTNSIGNPVVNSVIARCVATLIWRPSSVWTHRVCRPGSWAESYNRWKTSQAQPRPKVSTSRSVTRPK